MKQLNFLPDSPVDSIQLANSPDPVEVRTPAELVAPVAPVESTLPGSAASADSDKTKKNSKTSKTKKTKKAKKTKKRDPLDVGTLGQVFTPPHIVETMLALIKNSGRVLEPACGDGAFSKRLPHCTAIEIDTRHAPPGSLNIDFFTYPESEKFETIIGNPPYVRYRNIYPSTLALIDHSLFDARTNLYQFFIKKAVDHLADGGELIFITPRTFLKSTSNIALNRLLYSQGSITHAIDMGDSLIFSKADPNCLIWRFEKNCFDRTLRHATISQGDDLRTALQTLCWEERKLIEADGQLIFALDSHTLRLNEIASVKVGAVSGANDIYADEEEGNRDFVCADTARTGRTQRMIWCRQDVPPPALLPHKERLIARGIRGFNENNWWQWGRSYRITDAPRVYVNTITRLEKPFFLHPCNHYEGSIFANFPHNPHIDLQAFCDALNTVEWNCLGFICDGRYLFTQRSLENTPLPESFRVFLPEIAPT